jgi:hypothetical protein
MSYNHNYAYRNRQKWLDNKRLNEDWFMMDKKKKRKSLSKRLKMQQNGGRYIHVLDNEMVDNLCNMLKSTDNDDITLAKEIIFKSKMSNDHITRFVNEHLNILLGYSDNPRMTIHSNGFVGIGNAYSSHSLSISGTSTATVSTSGYISSGTSTNNAVTYAYTI